MIRLTLLPNHRPHRTHWSGALVAKACGISVSAVHRIWRANGLPAAQDQAVQTVQRSTFCRETARHRGTLRQSARARAIVLSVDVEKSQIQALDRTQPGLPMKKGRAGTMTHDYKRNGTTTLFAAFDVLQGKVIGRCMQQHRHQEFIRFLNAIEAEVPKGKSVHVVLDNYATHKHPTVLAWLARHKRFTFHFTPTSCSSAERRRRLLCQTRKSNGWGAAYSGPSSNSNPPSSATLSRQTRCRRHSSGPPIRTK